MRIEEEMPGEPGRFGLVFSMIAKLASGLPAVFSGTHVLNFLSLMLNYLSWHLTSQ